MAFKRKKALLKRIESIEEHLGIFYVLDSDDWGRHKEEEDGWGVVPKLKKEVKTLVEELKKATDKIKDKK